MSPWAPRGKEVEIPYSMIPRSRRIETFWY
jgi:hypothetical protein